jgi:hypothetical protein
MYNGKMMLITVSIPRSRVASLGTGSESEPKMTLRPRSLSFCVEGLEAEEVRMKHVISFMGDQMICSRDLGGRENVRMSRL